MMYASTKDFMKGFLDGIGAEMQATDLGEMGENEMKEKVFQSLTRK
jgi:cofilin